MLIYVCVNLIKKTPKKSGWRATPQEKEDDNDRKWRQNGRCIRLKSRSPHMFRHE